MFPRRTFALVDSALLFIRRVPVSIGAGLFGLLLDADRKAVPVSQAGNPMRHGTQQSPMPAVPPDETGTQRMNRATFDNRIRHLP